MGNTLDNDELKRRLENLSNIYLYLNEVLDSEWDKLPAFPRKEELWKKIKEIILNDKDLRNLAEGIQDCRPPRLMLMGRTGVGKSSLINAMCGAYYAKVSKQGVGTTTVEPYAVKRGNQEILHVLDTRGIAEGNALGGEKAEKALENAVFDFQPSVILFVCNICSRDDSVNADVQALQKLNRAYYKRLGTEIPVISVLSRTDELAPVSERIPANYSEDTQKTIEGNVSRYQGDFERLSFYPADVIAVSSYMYWGVPNEKSDGMTPGEIEQLKLKEDGRYHIDELIEIVAKHLPKGEDMGLMLAAQSQTVIKRVVNRLVNTFSTAASAIAICPIPFSDLPILWALEVVMVIMIATLGGETITMNAARKFLFSLAGIGGFGLAAQQFSKFLNAFFPGAGSLTSAGIAAGVVKLMGQAAILHYIDKKSIRSAEMKELLKKLKKIKETA